MKRVFSFFLVFGLVFGMCVHAAAHNTEDISPYYTNVSSASVGVEIDESGLITVKPQCVGVSGTTSIAATTYLEIKTGTLWTRISNGQPDSQWVGSTALRVFSQTYEFQLQASGTYRATTVFVVIRNGNSETIIVHSDEIYCSL